MNDIELGEGPVEKVLVFGGTGGGSGGRGGRGGGSVRGGMGGGVFASSSSPSPDEKFSDRIVLTCSANSNSCTLVDSRTLTTSVNTDRNDFSLLSMKEEVEGVKLQNCYYIYIG